MHTELSIVPAPSATATQSDYFGNSQTSFTLYEPHDRLIVESDSDLDVRPVGSHDFDTSPAWESVQKRWKESPLMRF